MPIGDGSYVALAAIVETLRLKHGCDASCKDIPFTKKHHSEVAEQRLPEPQKTPPIVHGDTHECAYCSVRCLRPTSGWSCATGVMPYGN